MIFVCDGSTEERHDAVARVLVDRSFEPMHAFGQHFEESIENLMPNLGIDCIRELERTLQVYEQHRELFALAFDCRATAQDLVCEMMGCVVLWCCPFYRYLRDRAATAIAEPRLWSQLR
jgi:hypothetical protein